MLELNFDLFPELTTARLVLRKMVNEDAPQLFEIRKNIDVMKYIDKQPHRTIEESNELINKIITAVENKEYIAWGLSLKTNPELIGTISFHRIEKEHYRAEIGYMIHPQFWRKGYTQEALKEVIQFGFKKMKLHSIEANINPNNLASASLLIKNGFIQEAYFKENYYFNGKFLDTAIYSLLTTEKADEIR